MVQTAAAVVGSLALIADIVVVVDWEKAVVDNWCMAAADQGIVVDL